MNHSKLILLIFIAFTSTAAYAQSKQIYEETAVQKKISDQTDEIEVFYGKQGFTLVKRLNTTLANMSYTPVNVEMSGPSLYIAVFVGSPAAKRIKLNITNNSQSAAISLVALKDQKNYVVHTMPIQGNTKLDFELYQRMPNKVDANCSFLVMKLNETGNVHINHYESERLKL